MRVKERTLARYCLFLLLITNCVCVTAQAQFPAVSAYSDSVLFAAYLHSDMHVWDSYLHSENFDSVPVREQLRYLSYEYGYVAFAIDMKAPDAQKHLADYGSHIAALEAVLPPATTLTYQSAYAAYEAKTGWNFLGKALTSYTLAQQAYKTDADNPLVLTLKGNIDFYSPKAFGGDKERALCFFRLAQEKYENTGDTLTNWNYAATRLCIVQCEDKSGNVKKALKLADVLLRTFPDFVYLRDEYIPDLTERSKTSHNSKK